MSLANFAQADLRFLLPIQAEQQVAIWGDAPALIETITEAQARCLVLQSTPVASKHNGDHEALSITDRSIPLASATLDHCFIPQLGTRETAWLLTEVQRILKPGGWLFLGVRNRLSLYHVGLKVQAPQASTLSHLHQLLDAAQWEIKDCYGVHEDLRAPQYLVSLASPEIASYFYDQIFMPYSQIGAWAQRLAVHVSKMGGQRFLFKDLGLVAQRL